MQKRATKKLQLEATTIKALSSTSLSKAGGAAVAFSITLCGGDGSCSGGNTGSAGIGCYLSWHC